MDSVVGVAAHCGLDGSNPGGTIFSGPIQTGPKAHPTSGTVGNRFFSRGKAAEAWCFLPLVLILLCATVVGLLCVEVLSCVYFCYLMSSFTVCV
jgi:hypothetical protein